MNEGAAGRRDRLGDLCVRPAGEWTARDHGSRARDISAVPPNGQCVKACGRSINSRARQEVRAHAKKGAAGLQMSSNGVSKSAHVQVDPSAGAIVQPAFGRARGDVATVLVRGPRRRANVVHGSANGQSARPARARAPGSEVIGASDGAPVPPHGDVDSALTQRRRPHGEGQRAGGGWALPDGGTGPCADECLSTRLETVPAIGAFGPACGTRPRARPARNRGGIRIR